jgi:hypothetical protein
VLCSRETNEEKVGANYVESEWAKMGLVLVVDDNDEFQNII